MMRSGKLPQRRTLPETRTPPRQRGRRFEQRLNPLLIIKRQELPMRLTNTLDVRQAQPSDGTSHLTEGAHCSRDLAILEFLMTDAVARCGCPTCARRRLALELPSRIARRTNAPAHVVAVLNAEARQLFVDLDAIENGHQDVRITPGDDDIPF
jgi:hypothetical protein